MFDENGHGRRCIFATESVMRPWFVVRTNLRKYFRLDGDDLKKFNHSLTGAVFRAVSADGARAAQVTYYLFLSFVPFIMVAVSLAGVLVPSGVDALFDFFPADTRELIETLIAEMRRTATAFVPAAAAVAIWSASRGVYTLLKGIGEIYGRQRGEGLAALAKSLLFAVLYCGALITVLAVGAAGSRFSGWLLSLAGRVIPVLDPQTGAFGLQGAGIRYLFVFSLLTVFFTFTFAAASRGGSEPMTLISHVAGAALSAFGWLVFSIVFTYCVDNFSDFSRVYGSLGSVVLLIVWLNVCARILFAGARINMLKAKTIDTDVSL